MRRFTPHAQARGRAASPTSVLAHNSLPGERQAQATTARASAHLAAGRRPGRAPLARGAAPAHQTSGGGKVRVPHPLPAVARLGIHTLPIRRPGSQPAHWPGTRPEGRTPGPLARRASPCFDPAAQSFRTRRPAGPCHTVHCTHSRTAAPRPSSIAGSAKATGRAPTDRSAAAGVVAHLSVRSCPRPTALSGLCSRHRFEGAACIGPRPKASTPRPTISHRTAAVPRTKPRPPAPLPAARA